MGVKAVAWAIQARIVHSIKEPATQLRRMLGSTRGCRMNSEGDVLFLFLALTLPTAPAWCAYKLDLAPHHFILALWAVGVIAIVAVCAGLPFESVGIGSEAGHILERFVNVFGFFGVLFAVAVGIGVGEAGASAWKHYTKRA